MIKGKLNGFSDYILSNIDEFDPVFERMADKYGGIAGIGSTGNPFADLGILMLTQLAMFFFVSNSRPGTKAPTAEEIQEKYPNAVRDAATKMAEEMRLKDELFRRQQQQQQQQQDMRAAAAAHDFGHSAFQPVMLYPPSAQSPPPLEPTFLHKAPSEQLLLMSGPPMPGSPMPGPPMSGPPMPMPPMPVFDEEETFPVKGTNQMKVIDMPESAVTRRGRPLKINGPPKRSSSTPPAEKLERTDKPERTEIVVV
jgi:flagellar motor protein MotB